MLDLADPTGTLLAVVEALRVAGIESAVYGGLALAAYGEPRETKDADVAVCGVGAEAAKLALEQAGLDVVVAFERTLFGGNFLTRLTLIGGAGTSGLNTADLVEARSVRFARLSLDRAVSGQLRGVSMNILMPEDFVIYKILSTRERDLEDAISVVRNLASMISRDLINEEAKLLAREIPDHDVLGRLARVLG